MSVQYQKEIFSNGKIRLIINYNGVDSDNIITKENISLLLYAINIQTLEPIFSEKLNFQQIKTLYDHLNSVSVISGEAYTTSEFTEITEDIAEIMSMIKHIDVKSLKSLFEKIDHNEKIDLLLKALTENEIQNLHATIRQNNHRKAITNLLLLLELEEKDNIVEEIKSHATLLEYKAGQPEKIFQNWIEHNLWTLGIDYVKKHPARLISLESESDLIMETTDGFIDLIELKRPSLKLFKYDLSHKSYFPSVDLSKALGQCLLYLKALDEYKLNLERTHKFKLLRPRIKIIIGRSKNFSDEEYEALRMLNSTLNHIQIITYDYLHMCGENIISYYSEEIDKVIKQKGIDILPIIS